MPPRLSPLRTYGIHHESAGGISLHGFPLVADDRRRSRRDAERDMGVALGMAARNLRASPQFARVAAMQGLNLLEAAVSDRPNEPDRSGITGASLRNPGPVSRTRSSAFNEVLGVEPGRELALRSSGRILTRLARRCTLARGRIAKDDRNQPVAIRLSPGGWLRRLLPGRRVGPKPLRHAARHSGSTPSYSTRGRSWSSVICGLTSSTRPTPSSRSCSASTPQAAKSGSVGMSSRNRPDQVAQTPSRPVTLELTTRRLAQARTSNRSRLIWPRRFQSNIARGRLEDIPGRATLLASRGCHCRLGGGASPSRKWIDRART